MAADPLLGPALPAILAFGPLSLRAGTSVFFAAHNPPLRDENPISIIALDIIWQNRRQRNSARVPRRRQGIGSGIRPSPWFDFSAWKSRFTINNIARI